MKKNWAKKSILVVGVIFGGFLYGEPLRVEVADMREDLHLLEKEFGRMRLEIEELRRENRDLRQKMESVKGFRQELADYRNEISGRVNEMVDAFNSQKRVVLDEVSKQFGDWTSKTQVAMEKLVNEVNTLKTTEKEQVFIFTDDYPKQGKMYTVKRGDTISHIAQKFNSTSKDIQNANQIADPKTMRAGDVIFVPINSTN